MWDVGLREKNLKLLYIKLKVSRIIVIVSLRLDECAKWKTDKCYLEVIVNESFVYRNTSVNKSKWGCVMWHHEMK